MSNKTKTVSELMNLTPEGRYDYMVDQIKAEKIIWTLQDQDGCVMLTTEDEDCIPMWPSEETAALWAVDEWKDCEPLAIPLDEFQERWVSGMEDDDLFIAVFPVQEDLGVVVPPFEMNERILPKKQQKH
ncbi:DUF2750 domain-containing protein [Shewanella sp. SR43-4]|jgi:hypothetical protein|uniref:DUF2750 domain-containing protein n=1 Tax=Shewanella vesiculosa TaxID=518738 RepID=A0ABV0FRQ1_9GAMM|nr:MULTISPECIES: DUF2750 domain-containing protein [Shewanella]NCQ44683.1 DUF2750 domain-containing protein [Shewanella frigidimarina]MBB1318653.1 DUF2750 domain-containing protein [Shewanella sp. SR43-4]MBB1321274.1 DUF2750 domain-containing protein [Shewanella sp. SR43-8]MBB1389843.1 DUF2750 domain-containing protein [Shewanella sp. SG44-6]MBB1474197.1 DUF2750 domain-containing protein [Shewanella sp. SG41-3]|tara:strand:+ start:2720 stop:3106 length:387 start_codon:yes stop_codon:yes gene_type:complete